MENYKDYKQKYEEALERAKDIYNDDPNSSTARAVCEQIFPELKESEDERIREEIIKFLQLPHPQFVGKRNHEKWIAWLEKQGEQKSTDKVEPKFHAGDFIINEHGFIMQIDDIDGNMYIYHVLDGNKKLTYDITKTDKSCHLWTIQDAKDGDVLADGYSVIIFRKIGNDAWDDVIDFYVGYNNDSYKINIQNGMSHYGNINTTYFKPTTKEQRNLLFQKMKEAGYEWDNKKKELKKIEQKPAWSEEDESLLQDITNDIKIAYERAHTKQLKDIYSKQINWLKSLKERYTWKPSHEQMDALDSTLQYNQVSRNSFEHLNSLFNDLKKLK